VVSLARRNGPLMDLLGVDLVGHRAGAVVLVRAHAAGDVGSGLAGVGRRRLDLGHEAVGLGEGRLGGETRGHEVPLVSAVSENGHIPVIWRLAPTHYTPVHEGCKKLCTVTGKRPFGRFSSRPTIR